MNTEERDAKKQKKRKLGVLAKKLLCRSGIWKKREVREFSGVGMEEETLFSKLWVISKVLFIARIILCF